jgi:branched-chain amino acid transport system ATP-binding protein
MPLTELSLANVSAGYGGTTVLENVSISVKRGERVGIIGRNGSGKTTTLAAALGFAELRSGAVMADRISIGGYRSFRRARLGIGYVPQTRDIFPSLTVEENLEAGLNGRPRQCLEEAYILFPRLFERRRNNGRDLSGGEQQMLSIARALMNDVNLLLLDEPLEGLAPIIVQELLRSIERLVRDEGLSAIIVEQNPKQILPITHQAIVLDRGQVVHAAPSAQLLGDREMLDRWLAVARA